MDRGNGSPRESGFQPQLYRIATDPRPFTRPHGRRVDYAMALYPNDPILFGSLKEAGISARGF
jgi:hypothetical protein